MRRMKPMSIISTLSMLPVKWLLGNFTAPEMQYGQQRKPRQRKDPWGILDCILSRKLFKYPSLLYPLHWLMFLLAVLKKTVSEVIVSIFRVSIFSRRIGIVVIFALTTSSYSVYLIRCSSFTILYKTWTWF